MESADTVNEICDITFGKMVIIYFELLSDRVDILRGICKVFCTWLGTYAFQMAPKVLFPYFANILLERTCHAFLRDSQQLSVFLLQTGEPSYIPELNLVFSDTLKWSAENGMLQCNCVMRKRLFVRGFCTFDISRCRRK